MHKRARTASMAALMLALLALWPWSCEAQSMASGERTLTVNGTQRSYSVYVSPKVSRPAPVVFVFHGGGGRPEAIARVTRLDDVADQNGFVTVYPEGAPAPSGRGGTWNVGGEKNPSSADDVAFVQAILRDLDQALPIDRARIYATGVSMGGVFAYRLACEMSDTFAAIAPVAATKVEPSCQPRSPVAILHIHGSDDDRIPLKGGRGEKTAVARSWPAPQLGVASWTRYDSCGGGSSSHKDGDADCTSYAQCRAAVEYCVIAGGGHGWPSGASDRIWTFFAAHPKPAS